MSRYSGMVNIGDEERKALAGVLSNSVVWHFNGICIGGSIAV